MEKFAVGKKAPKEVWKNLDPNSGNFSINHEDGGWFIFLRIYKPIDEEKEFFNKEMKVKIITTIEKDFLLTLIEFDENLSYELPFDPTIYTRETQDKLLENNLVTIIIIDSSDGTIIKLRAATFPRKYETIAKPFWKKIINEYGFGNYTKINNEYYESLINKYSAKELLHIGKHAGYFGDLLKIGGKK